jgi:hypothetical protein
MWASTPRQDPVLYHELALIFCKQFRRLSTKKIKWSFLQNPSAASEIMMSQTFLISLCFISAHLLLEEVVEILDLRQAGRLLTPSCRQRMTQFISSDRRIPCCSQLRDSLLPAISAEVNISYFVDRRVRSVWNVWCMHL